MITVNRTNPELLAKSREAGTNTELITETKDSGTNTELPKAPYTSSDDSSEESGEEGMSRKPPVHELLNSLHKYEFKLLTPFTTFTMFLLS